jgi:hemolysin III
MDFLNFREPFNAWSHALWLLMSIPATLLLWRRSGGDLAKRLSLLVFGLSLAACYLGSTLYHGVRADRDGIELFDRLDHVGIHILIAGSYTPVAWNLMRGRWRWGTLAAVWAATVAGSGLHLVNLRVPISLATCEYIVLGWGALFCYFEIARELTHRPLWPLVVGGVFYTVGAVINLAHWPAIWPGVVSPHGFFHLWVMAGSLTHFWFMLTVVVPFACVAEAESARSPAAVALPVNGPPQVWQPARVGPARAAWRLGLGLLPGIGSRRGATGSSGV